jgi:murein DD-endopeptidase MepM/ murein hydrolase activator NlpD
VPRAGALFLAGVVAAALFASAVHAAGDPSIAALQVALRAQRAYPGPVDGVEGPRTDAAIRRFQRRRGLAVDGIAGPLTRTAMARKWRRPLGRRVLQRGAQGWDVAELQFRLAWRGFPCGTFDGAFGPRTEAAVRRLQRWAGLLVDGRVGAATLAALRRPRPSVPYTLERPVDGQITSSFGPRGARFHAGLDFASPSGTPVRSAAPGRAAYAGWLDGGWGKLVSVAHRGGVRTLYAHLSRIDVHVGQRVGAGTQIGAVGATGVLVSGPHLHFEVRVRGAAADPAPVLR